MRTLVCAFLFLFGTTALAQKRVAVLPLPPGQGIYTKLDRKDYTERFRVLVSKALSDFGLVVATQANFEALYGEGKCEEDFTAGCVVTTGQKLEAVVAIHSLLKKGKAPNQQPSLLIVAYDVDKGTVLESVEFSFEPEADLIKHIEQETKLMLMKIRSRYGAASDVASTQLTLGGDAPAAVDFEMDGGVNNAVLRVESTPTGVLVNVDGRALCETPCSKTIATGTRQIVLTKLGYVGASKTVDVRASTTVRFDLQKDEGTLSLTSTPSGAPVTIKGVDGLVPGNHTTPLNLGVRPGVYTVTVGSAKCTKPHTQRLKVSIGKTTTAAFQPAVLPAGLKVNVKDGNGDDIEAVLEADGVELGSTLRAHKIAVCSRDVAVSLGGESRQSVVVTLRPSQLVTVDVVFGDRYEIDINGSTVYMLPLIPKPFVMKWISNSKREAELSKSYYLSAHEVTQHQYSELMGKLPPQPIEAWNTQDDEWKKENKNRPVQVTWSEAVLFANALSKKQGLPLCYATSYSSFRTDCHVKTIYDCEGYRLPTDAEWSHARRSGLYGPLRDIAWSKNDTRQWRYVLPAPVGLKAPNEFGLYDLFGNVSEWVHDHIAPGSYEDRQRPKTDPVGSQQGARRGGAWNSSVIYLEKEYEVKSTNRERRSAGIRLARTIHSSPTRYKEIECRMSSCECVAFNDNIACKYPLSELMIEFPVERCGYFYLKHSTGTTSSSISLGDVVGPNDEWLVVGVEENEVVFRSLKELDSKGRPFILRKAYKDIE